MKIGIVTDEFFDPYLQGIGGFGWAARRVATIFREHTALGIEPVFVSGELRETPERREAQAHRVRIILRAGTKWANLVKMQRERFDLLLLIDYNQGYSVYLRALPRTPVIVWVRDPRTKADAVKVHSCRIPSEPGVLPQGLFCCDGAGMGALIQEARWLRRKLIFATPAPHLIEKLEDCYGVEPPRLFSLPNPLRLPPGPVRKSEQPSVVFLGRLDPIKRPWIFVELARRFPAVTFRMLGQSHFQGPGAYVPENLPPNLHLLGHTDETEKARWLREAWVAVNCSIHEALAVSILESFACETPVLSCQDPGYLVSRFGHYAGRFDGSGMEGLDAFAAGLRTLLTAREATLELGRQARAWVESQHSEEHFLERFARLRAMCGLSSQ